jgi:cyclophilin family peptidyl-prolyl cis-trans isomerase
MLRRWLMGALALAVSVGTAVAQTDSTKGASSNAAATPQTAKQPAGKAASGMDKGEQVVMLDTAQGPIVIKLRDDVAPKTCANFRKLVKEGFYDGTYFHRVIPGFMIQGGDPNTKNADPNDDGLGGPGYTVPAEIKLKHDRGSVATARTGDAVNPKRDSSGSQFFIDVREQPSLDAGGYTVFGEVISGLETVDKIVNLANDPATLKGQMGPNPQKKALIKKASLVPLASVQKAAPASTPAPGGTVTH